MPERTVPRARHLSDLLDTASEADCEDGVGIVAAASVVISLVRMISMEEARHEADADDDFGLFDCACHWRMLHVRTHSRCLKHTVRQFNIAPTQLRACKVTGSVQNVKQCLIISVTAVTKRPVSGVNCKAPMINYRL
jgi:hypothetical protein